MSMETRYLLAWAVPDHVLIPLEQLRKNLFSETGCISLRALEPFVPIGYIPEPVTKQDLPQDIAKPNPIIWDIFDVQEGALFLLSKSPYTLSDSHLGFSADTVQVPIPAVPGIFIGSGDISDYIAAKPSLLKELNHRFGHAEFTLSQIVLLKLTFDTYNVWWEHVSFSIIKLKSLK